MAPVRPSHSCKTKLRVCSMLYKSSFSIQAVLMILIRAVFNTISVTDYRLEFLDAITNKTTMSPLFSSRYKERSDSNVYCTVLGRKTLSGTFISYDVGPFLPTHKTSPSAYPGLRNRDTMLSSFSIFTSVGRPHPLTINRCKTSRAQILQ